MNDGLGVDCPSCFRLRKASPGRACSAPYMHSAPAVRGIAEGGGEEHETRESRATLITDELVEAAALAMFADEHCDKRQMLDVPGNWDARLNDEDQALYRSMARAALEAAAPLLGPKPLLDRDAVCRVLIAFGADTRGRAGAWKPAETLANAVDAVMELARPTPTREQIVDAVGAATGHVAEMDQHEEGEWENGCASCAGWGYPCATLADAADAVLALFSKPAGPECVCLHDETGTEVSALCTVHNPRKPAEEGS